MMAAFTTLPERMGPMPTLPWKAPNSPPPADGPVTVMASRLELRRLSDVPSFLAAALRIRRQMLASPGVLGLSLIAQPLHRTFWTLSAWQDQAALSAAVGRLQLRHLDRHGRADYLGRGAAPPGEAGHRARPPIMCTAAKEPS